MSYQMPPQPLQNPAPKRRHGVRNGCLIGFGIVAVAVIAIGAVAAALSGGNGGRPAATSTSTGPASPVYASPVTAATPSPDGKYNGACDYTLGSDPVGGTAMATGDIQVRNTGNVGIAIKLKITWPQQGYAPLAMTKTVKLATGASRDVQFHRSISQTEIENLQNWQGSHDYADGCTYKGTIIHTFGPAS